MPVQAEEAEDFKSKYKNLKRKLKILIYENECFQEELGKANRALLRVRQDKNFLLEQLLHYQQPPASSSDSDLTDNSENESNVTVQSVKRKRFGDGITGTSAALPLPPSAATGNSTGGRPSSNSAKPASKPSSSTTNKQHCPTASSSGSTGAGGGGGGGSPAAIVPAANKKRTLLSVNRLANKPANKNSGRQRRAPHKPLTVVGTSNAAGHRNAVQGSGSSARGTCDADEGAEERELSREEVERHLLSRQTIADFHTPVSLTLPHQLFSDNLMDGDLLEEIETSPSNLEEDINVDNYE